MGGSPGLRIDMEVEVEVKVQLHLHQQGVTPPTRRTEHKHQHHQLRLKLPIYASSSTLRSNTNVQRPPSIMYPPPLANASPASSANSMTEDNLTMVQHEFSTLNAYRDFLRGTVAWRGHYSGGRRGRGLLKQMGSGWNGVLTMVWKWR